MSNYLVNESNILHQCMNEFMNQCIVLNDKNRRNIIQKLFDNEFGTFSRFSLEDQVFGEESSVTTKYSEVRCWCFAIVYNLVIELEVESKSKLKSPGD